MLASSQQAACFPRGLTSLIVRLPRGRPIRFPEPNARAECWSRAAVSLLAQAKELRASAPNGAVLVEKTRMRKRNPSRKYLFKPHRQSSVLSNVSAAPLSSRSSNENAGVQKHVGELGARRAHVCSFPSPFGRPTPQKSKASSVRLA